MYWVTPPSVIAVGVLLPGLATFAVSLRLYLRRLNAVGLGVDDWLILLSLTLCIACGVVLIVGAATNGLGQPTPDGVSPVPGLPGFMFAKSDSLLVTWRCKFAFNLLQMPAFGAAKLSVVFFYRRIFRGMVFDICSKVVIGIIIVWTVAFFFTILFQCQGNFWALWSTLFDFLTHCMSDLTYLEANSISDVVTDIFILALPVPMVSSESLTRIESDFAPQVWKLQMSTARKIGVCAVFLTGFLCVLKLFRSALRRS